MLKRLGPIALELDQLERNRQPSTGQPTLYDIEGLRRLGLTEFADRLEEKLRKQLEVKSCPRRRTRRHPKRPSRRTRPNRRRAQE